MRKERSKKPLLFVLAHVGRNLESVVSLVAKEYPVVLVTGPRQLGKIAMLQKLMEGSITAVAARCDQMVNVAEIARDANINQTQAKDWLGILETLGINFYLHPYSNNLLKRLVKTPKSYFYDTGLVRLTGIIILCRFG